VSIASIVTTKPLHWIPPAADGVSVTPNASAWVNSAWVQISASTPGIWTLQTVTAFSDSGPSPVHFEIDIGTGASGSEVVVGTLPGCKESTTWNLESYFLSFGIPISIEAGLRVAVRLRKQGTDTTAWTIALGYYEDDVGTSNITTLPQLCVPSAADPINVASGGASWSVGSWVELSPSLDAGSMIVGVSMQRPDMVSNDDLILEIGVGAVSSETVLTRIATTEFSNAFHGVTRFVVPHRLATTTRVSARLSQSYSSGARTCEVKLIYYGPQTAASGDLKHQVIEYIGNGITGRLILTAFPLNVGNVAVWIYPVLPAGAGTATPPVVRTSADATNSWLDGTAGTSANFITSLTADGFTLGAGDAFGKVNTSGTKYIAIVVSDVSTDGDFIKTGIYTGNGVDGRLIEVNGGDPWQPTHVWVHGISHVYRSTEFVGDSSVTLRASVAGVNMIQSFETTGFTVGTSVNTNTNTNAYGYVAFRAGPEFLATGFASFTLQGTAVDDVVSGLGFTPGFLLAKEYNAAGVSYYKSTTFPNNAADLGDDSQGWNSTNDTGAAVKSLVFGGAVLGSVVAPAGATIYGWAWDDVDTDAPPSTSPCTGGGTVASGTNPSAGTSLATATTIHKWMEVTIGATTYRWSDVAINFTTAKEPRVLSWGRAARGLTDGRGGIETAAMTIRLADVDRVLRGLHSTSVLLNKVATIYAADEATIRAAGTPWTVFTGVVRDFRPESDLSYRLVLEDALTLSISAFAQERLVPSYLIGPLISDGNPVEKVWDSPAQICYGALSDEDDEEPEGTVLCPFIAAETLPGHEELGNLYKYLVCRGASHDVQAVFVGDPFSGTPPTTRAKAGAGEYGTRLWVPHRAGWLEAVDYAIQDSRRWTYIYLDQNHPGADPSRQNKIPLLANICGRETTGDATGNTIDSLPLQLLHFLNNEVVQDATGNWLSIKALGAYSLLDTASFTTVKTRSEARIAGGYIGASVIGYGFRQITLRDAIAQFCQSGDFDLGVNGYGQITITMLDRTSTAASAPIFTDEHDILKDSFSIDPKTDEIENKIRYVYKRKYAPELQQLNPKQGTRLPREPFDANWLSGLQTVEDATSISDIKETRESQLLELEMVRDAATADDVAAQRLALRCPSKGRAVATFDVTVSRGASVELGDIVKVTHFQGLGASGWTAQRLQVRRIELDLDRLTISLTCRDVHDLLA
jgi:hypothetical protein